MALTLQRPALDLEGLDLRAVLPLRVLDHQPDELPVAPDRLDAADDELLELIGGDRLAVAAVVSAVLCMRAYVVAVSLRVLRRERVQHRAVAALAPQQPLEQGAVHVVDLRPAGHGVEAELGLHEVPRLLVDDRLVLPVVHVLVVRHLPDVEHVGEHRVEQSAVDRQTTNRAPVLGGPLLRRPAALLQVVDDAADGLAPQVRAEDLPHLAGLCLVHDELAAHVVVTEHGPAARVLAPLAGGGDLVPRALRDDLPLELREREQDVQRQPPHRMGCVELLGDGDKRHLVAVVHLHHLHEVCKGPRETVHLVDHHAVNHAGGDVVHEAAQRGALHVAARESAVVVLGREAYPALVLLARDVRLAALTLGVQRVELLVQPLLAALARVDRAADVGRRRRGGTPAHADTPSALATGRLPRSIPKNRLPFQWFPVAALATAERDL